MNKTKKKHHLGNKQEGKDGKSVNITKQKWKDDKKDR